MSQPDSDRLRSNLFDLLETIGDYDAQLAYEESVPIANVPAEWVCAWFDDLYHPETELHAEAFSTPERKLLARFHAAFDDVVEGLPTDGGVRTLQADPGWIALSAKARRTASEIRSAL